jgi:predicted ATP-dependent endonuclease of OLD family
MINFPIFKRLDISDFGLYPGLPGGEQGLHIEFKNGLTLVLGANGLGKTTLVNILYRLLTGPFDIPGLTDRPELGNLKIEAKSLNKYDKSIFSKRVVDAAAYSRARLIVQFGDYEVVVERNLQSLNLTLFSVDGEVLSNDEVVSFQSTILEITGVSSFGDWILLLRHLVFYFEDRRALVWDTSAQKEILRILFLSNDISKQWTADAREILEVDSRMRNLSAVLGKEEKALSQTEAKTKDGIATIEELKLIEQLQSVDELQLEKLQEDFAQVEANLQLNNFLKQTKNSQVHSGQ